MATTFKQTVALISDTHGQLDNRIAKVVEGSDWIVHAGDIGNAAVLHQLAGLADKVVAVRGNNDTPSHWPEEDHDILSALPHERIIDLPGGELLVVHGHRVNPASARHQRLRRRYPAVRAIVYGHSHKLADDRQGSPWVLNPGAAGRTRTYGGPSCLLLRIQNGEWQLETRRFKLERRR